MMMIIIIIFKSLVKYKKVYQIMANIFRILISQIIYY